MFYCHPYWMILDFKKALQIIFLVIFNSEFRIWLFLTNYTQSKPEIKWELGGVEQSLVWLSRKPSLILALREFEIIIIKWALKPRSEKILFFFFLKHTHSFSINSLLAVHSPKCSTTEHAYKVRVKYFSRSSNNLEVDYCWGYRYYIWLEYLQKCIKCVCICREYHIVSCILFVMCSDGIVAVQWLQGTPCAWCWASIQNVG